MERLNDALQNRLQYIVIKSPCVLSDEQLSVDEYELTAISSLKEEDGVAADVNIEDLKVMDAQDEEAQAGLEEISVAHSNWMKVTGDLQNMYIEVLYRSTSMGT